MLGEDATARLHVALDLADLAEEVMRATLRRRNPNASAEQIDDLLAAWFAERPGADHGDADGAPLDLAKWR